MKTPEEIKKGLECCKDYQSCTECGEPKCPYNDIRDCVNTLFDDVLAYIQQLEARVPRWIPVEERLPEHGKYVLCWYSDIDGDEWHTVGKVMDDGRWRVDIYEIDEQEYYTVTHWMPLPEAPKED